MGTSEKGDLLTPPQKQQHSRAEQRRGDEMRVTAGESGERRRVKEERKDPSVVWHDGIWRCHDVSPALLTYNIIHSSV